MPLKHTVEEIVLKNGARGLLIDIPDSSVVSYDVSFRAGNYFVDRKEAQQAAHLMEHMVFGSTKNFPSTELFSQEFSRNGAYNNAITYEYTMNYVADCAVMEWDRILDLQRQAITEPAFTETLLASEKGNVVEELTGQANNHGRVLWQTMRRAMGETAFLDTEKLATVPEVGLRDIESHHQNTHTLNNMRFCFAGDLGRHRDVVIDQLEKWDLPAGRRLAIPSSRVHSTKPVWIYRKDLPSVIFALHISLNRRLTEDEDIAMGAVNHILSGTFHSRIYGKSRSLGICYGMHSSAGDDADNISNWEFVGQISPKNAKEMYELIAEQLQKVADGDITEQELEEAKQYALGKYQMRAQTVRGVSNWYSGWYFDSEKIDLLEDSPERIKQTSLGQIQKIVKEFLEEGEWGVGVIGNISEDKVRELDDAIAVVCKKR